MVTATVIRSFLYLYFLNDLTIELLILIEIIILGFIFVGEFLIFINYVTKLNKRSSDLKIPFDRSRIKRYGFFSFLNEIGAGIVGKASDFFIIESWLILTL